jgi:beta-glucosidase-like glycosyl hydrolase/CubicO group peptidase (beta-lactamase class C family)
MKYCVTLLAFLFSLNAASMNNVQPTLLAKTNKHKMEQWVDSVLRSMTIDDRIGQLMMVIADGNTTEANKKRIKSWIENQRIGGVLFSASDPLSQAELTNYAQKLVKTPLMIGLDGEWGLSMRLVNTTRFPRNMMLGAVNDDSLVYYYGKEMARQCRLMGIHVNFAPDIDVNSNPENPVIGLRSFGEDPKKVAQFGILYAKGLEEGGVLSVAKHFPGHGDTSTDSHYTLPLVKAGKQRLEDVEIVPFQRYIQAGLGGMMVGHLNIPSLDSLQQPSSLSKNIVQKLLKDDLGFQGLVFTDGLAMKGVSNEPNMSVRALLAGNDILLGATNPAKEFAAIKEALATKLITEELINEKCRKVLTYKYILGLNRYRPISTRTLLSDLNSIDANWLNRKLNEKSITLLKNDGRTIPLKQLNKRSIALISLGGNSDAEFLNTLNLYDKVDAFSVSDNSRLGELAGRLGGYNTLIISVNSRRNFSKDTLSKLCEGKEYILNFFTTPYEMQLYADLVKGASAVICSYENTELSQSYAAQAIFGGVALDAELPVSVQGLFKKGKGIQTRKARLGYSIPEEVGVNSDRLSNIDKIVQEGIDAQAFPGCQVLVAKDGVVIYNKAFGNFDYKSGRKVLANDLYDLASMTKASATIPALMKLHDDGHIGLTDYLSKYIPVLRSTNKEKLTIREALFHETGLKAFIPFYSKTIDQTSYSGSLFSTTKDARHTIEYDAGAWANPDFKYLPQMISFEPMAGYNLQVAKNMYANDRLRSVILEEIAQEPLVARGSYLYSDLNFILLREVVEAASKNNINDYLQNNFYRRLGANTTTYLPLLKFDSARIAPTENDQFLRKQLLQGYVDDEAAAFLGGISGNAGLFSSANDLAKLYQMWLNGGTYGDEQYISQKTCDFFTKSKSVRSRRGLGFDKPDPRSLKASPCSYSTPPSTYGHTGFTGTCFWIDPDNGLVYIFLSNRVNESRTHKKLLSLNIRTRIQEEIYKSFIRPQADK